MSARVATHGGKTPGRARYLVPKDLPRRGQILAACIVLTVLAHVLFAQLTLALAVVFTLTAKVTRWRRSWLLVPVIVAAGWTLAVGLRAAVAGFAAGPPGGGYLGAPGISSTTYCISRRLQRQRELAAPPAAAGHPGGRRRGGRHRLAELAAY